MASAGAGFKARGVLRRSLSPTGWVVFEVLVERSETVAGERVAVASVRTVAAELGVAKNTAARALGALRTAGVVTIRQTRDGAGRFAQASYVIHTAAPTIHPPGAYRFTPDTHPRTTRRHRRVDSAQLTLLEQV